MEIDSLDLAVQRNGKVHNAIASITGEMSAASKYNGDLFKKYRFLSKINV